MVEAFKIAGSVTLVLSVAALQIIQLICWLLDQ